VKPDPGEGYRLLVDGDIFNGLTDDYWNGHRWIITGPGGSDGDTFKSKIWTPCRRKIDRQPEILDGF
jgi:hypothetical protein